MDGFLTAHYFTDKKWSWCRLSCCALLALSATSAWADSDFEEEFLRRDKNGATPEVFLYQNAITPGKKQVDIQVNGKLVDRYDIWFTRNDKTKEVNACLSTDILRQIGIKTGLYQGWKQNETPDAPLKDAPPVCEDVATRIPAAQISYEDNLQVLLITVPQEAVDSQRFTMISPKEWDDGVPSLRTSYSSYFYYSKIKATSGDGYTTDDQDSKSSYISLNSVGTLGAWRLYSMDSFSKNPDQGWENNHDRLYVARDIAALRSRLQAGDLYTYTPSTIMGTLPIRGVTLGTSSRMMFDNQVSYSPVIRGVARTNARLTVRQHNNIIYSTTLTPGAFAIDDLYSAQVGADLDVTVEESDGSQQKFTVPYTALPNMIRPGAMRYNLSAGEYRNSGGGDDKPVLATASLEYGFEKVTLNNTLLASKDYQSAALGAAWNMGSLGAFSLETAIAQYKAKWDDGDTRRGAAVRFLYAKQFDDTNTGLQILGYQYRSRDFIDFSEFISRLNQNDINGWEYGESGWNRRKLSRVEMSINQGLGGAGSLYLSASQDRYYGTRDKSTSVTGGFGTQIGKANVSVSYTYTKDHDYGDNQISLNVSIPLSWGNDRDTSYDSFNSSMVRDRDNHYSHSIGYNGSALDNTLSYSGNLQRNTDNTYTESGSLGYSSDYATLGGSVGHSDNSMQYSASINGGVLLYGGGVILAPSMGNTIGIVETPGAPGVGVSGSNANHTDRWGRAVVSWLTPYRYNTITLDTTNTEGVELKESARQVVPTDGAAVLLRYATRVGRRAMVVLKSIKSIPVGAIAYAEGEKDEAGIVGGHGLLYLSGLDARSDQKVNVIWGQSTETHCAFVLPAATPEQMKPDNWYKKITVRCK